MKSFMKSLKEGASKSAASSKNASKLAKKPGKTEEKQAKAGSSPPERLDAVAAGAASDSDPIAAATSSSSSSAATADRLTAPPEPSLTAPSPDRLPVAGKEEPEATLISEPTLAPEQRISSSDPPAPLKSESESPASLSEVPLDHKTERTNAEADKPEAEIHTSVCPDPKDTACNKAADGGAEPSEMQPQPVNDRVLHQEKNESDADQPLISNHHQQQPVREEDVSSYALELQRHGLQTAVSSRLCLLFSSGKLCLKDLDDRAIDALKEYGNLDAVLTILEEFENSNLEHVNNKSAFLCGLMKTHRQKEKALKHKGLSIDSNSSGKDIHSSISVNGFVTLPSAGGVISDGPSLPAVAPGPDEANLKAILQRTGYTLDVTSGQRKYGGPPPNWTDLPPGPGCEIFVGKIPKELFEEELIPLFEEVGQIWDLRLMIDPVNGYNRGFAFITYCTKEEATSAQIRFDGYEIRKGKPLKVNVSVPNLRLFVGNIPKSKSKSEIFNEFNKLTGGLHEVIVYSSPDDRKKNRGFCFLEYESHKSASLAKRKLSTGRTKVWGCDILVDWADPQEEPDQATMERVKVLYVRNLVADVTEDELKEVFAVYGQIERVKKIKDYAFIHFENRDHAVRAMRNLHESELRGVKISVSLAKPPSDRKKKEEILRNRERRVTLMMQQRTLVPGMGMGGQGNMPPLQAHPVPLSLSNGVGLRSAKGMRGQSYQVQGVPPVSPFRPLPPYHPASAWAQLPEWLPYNGYPANWNWTYGADPRTSHLTAAGGPGAQYSRSMGLPTHPGPHMSAAPLNANSRNHRSLWTPNGPGNSSINGPSMAIDHKPKNWRRNRNGDNNGSGHKSGFEDGRL